jgi:GTPase SAR1 family protein
MNSKINDLTQYANTQENQQLDTKDSQEVSSKSDKRIIAKSPIEALKQMKMTRAERERALHMHFFIAGLIPQGYHLVLFGAAGSGKTTVMLYLCLQILLNNPDVEIFFLYLDGQLGMAANYEVYLEELGLDERYNILTNLNLENALTLIEEVVKTGERKAQELIIVLDTLKYLNPSINNKDSNVKAMQRIKKLTSLGVTFISLHHTNKDGENFSGTAEIEQDGDAILKIVTAPGEETHTKISTIEEGGRVRFHMEPKSYTFMQGDPTSVKELEQVIDPEKIRQQEIDALAISVIKGILNLEGKISKTELEQYLKEDDDFDYSEKERKRILRDYKDIHWKVTKGGERNNIHFYSAIDVTSKTIDSLNQKLDVC